MNPTASVTAFIGGLRWADVAIHARQRIEALLRDFVAVTCAGSAARTSRIAADYAAAQHAGTEATLLFDGRRASAIGAAWANGVLANALDFDDGHRLVKGHPGAIVIPAALSIAETIGATREELFAAITVGYEVSVRAGIALHAREADDRYHAGFTAAEPVVLGSLADPSLDELGQHWRVADVYVKAFPCCRWSQPAISAALSLRRSDVRDPHEIDRVTVRTFAAAAALSRRAPTTTEEAQYSLIWPIAAALVHGDFGVAHILPPAFDDAGIHRLASRIDVSIDPDLDSAFPALRRSAVTVETTAGPAYSSELTEAPGEPEDPNWAAIIADKFARYAGQLSAESPLRQLLT